MGPQTLIYLAVPSGRFVEVLEWKVRVTDNTTSFPLEARLSMRTTSAAPGSALVGSVTKIVARDGGNTGNNSFTVIGCPSTEPSYDVDRFLTPDFGPSTLGLHWQARHSGDTLLLEPGTEWGLRVMNASFAASDFFGYMLVGERG